MRHLKEDDALRTAPITVSVTNGICTLTGSVESLVAKDRALRVVQTLRGIRSVVDRVQVAPVARTDEQIKHDVLEELTHETVTKAHPVAVAVSGGTVTLTGAAPSWSDKTFYAELAKTAPGVKAIENKVTVTYATLPSDAMIEAATKRHIADDIWLDGSTIGVTVSGRTAHLKGFVGSVADEARARDDAWSAGAEMVEDDGMTVDWAARDDQRATTDAVYRSDDQIASAVRDAFRLDPRLEILAPMVVVHNGSVELTGMVDSMKAKRAAMLDAKDTTGVVTVHDLVVVHVTRPTNDADIESAVKLALSHDPFLVDAPSIHSSTTKGTVLLDGNAASTFERFFAVDDAANIPGVTEVVDNLAVKRSLDEIKATIEDRLLWDATIQRERVSVTMTPDGTATLNGVLESGAEIRAAANDATIGGATHLVNLLQRKSRTDR